jgi:hypothetical protein
MSKPNRFEIVFDNSVTTFFAGQTVTGKILIQTDNDITSFQGKTNFSLTPISVHIFPSLFLGAIQIIRDILRGVRHSVKKTFLLFTLNKLTCRYKPAKYDARLCFYKLCT